MLGRFSQILAFISFSLNSFDLFLLQNGRGKILPGDKIGINFDLDIMISTEFMNNYYNTVCIQFGSY